MFKRPLYKDPWLLVPSAVWVLLTLATLPATNGEFTAPDAVFFFGLGAVVFVVLGLVPALLRRALFGRASHTPEPVAEP